jgi:Cu/Ag efflux protein CusF
MTMKRTVAAILLAGLVAGALAHEDASFGRAQDRGSSPAPKRQSTGAVLGPNEGVVRNVDILAREITIRHGPLPEMDMPPMTMVFDVRDAALLKDVKAGDRIKFRSEMLDGKITLTKIERSK